MKYLRKDSVAMVLALLVASANSPLSAFEVISIFPDAHDVSVTRDAEISVVFSEPIDASSIDEMSFQVMAEQGGTLAGTLSVDGDSLSFDPASSFFAGDRIYVRMSREVRSVGGAQLAKPYSFSFRADVTPSSLGLQRVGETSVSSSSGLYSGDLDRDGSLDLVVLSEVTGGNNVSVFLNDGNGGYGPPTLYSAGDRPVEVLGADIDADGDIDLAVTNRTSQDMTIFLGRGDGTFNPGVLVATDDDGNEIALFDLEGDGDLDIVTSGCNFGICRVHASINDGLGGFPEIRLLGTSLWSNAAIRGEDMDSDGVSDVVVGFTGYEGVGDGTLEVYLARGGAASFVGSSRIPEAVDRIETADFDGDGTPDVLFMEDLSWLAIALSESPGVLSDFRFYSWAAGGDAGLGDMEGDGDLDIVSVASFSPDLGIMENDGLGNFTNAQEIDDTGYEDIVVYDRDGDGDLDAVVTTSFGAGVVFYDNR